jgi:uncharacterized phiE125 gp8 family phage protein
MTLLGPVTVNRTRLALVTAPLVEPVTLAEAKTYLGQDLDHHDDLIRSLIAAARGALEQTYGIAFMPQTWDQAVTWISATDAPPFRLLRTPIQSIESIAYVDDTSRLERFVPAGHVLLTRAGVRFTLPEGLSFPSAYVLRFVAGYGHQAAASMSFSAPTNTITRTTGSFVDDGFVVGDTIYTSATGPNHGPLTITAMTALELSVAENLSNVSLAPLLVATASNMPEALRVGILAFVAWLYEHRGDDPAVLVPAHIDRLVGIYGVPQSP